MTLKIPMFLSVLFTLSACAAVWGSPHKVVFESASSITINYDPMFTNWGEVQNIAQAHCDKYGKDAVPDSRSKTDWGLVVQAYDCKKRAK